MYWTYEASFPSAIKGPTSRRWRFSDPVPLDNMPSCGLDIARVALQPQHMQGKLLVESRRNTDFARQSLSVPNALYLAFHAVSYDAVHHDDAKSLARRGIDRWTSRPGQLTFSLPHR
jgi:hypothetical protein